MKQKPPEKIDWRQLARAVGSIDDSRPQQVSGGSHFARLALEKVLGPENIRSAVDLVLTWDPASELITSVLSFIRSSTAVDLAYEAYKNSSGNRDRGTAAVWLIQQIAHPKALDWVEEFLADDALGDLGVGVLDQLLWTGAVEYQHEPRAQRLLATIDQHPDAHLRDRAEFIRRYLRERELR